VQDYPEQYDAAVACLKSRNADSIDHSGGDLLGHFEATAELLRQWGNSPDVCLAGLCHAVYGTEGFPQSILDVSERGVLQDVIGPAAEGLVYFYGSSERNSFCPTVTLGPVRFRDRFTGTVFEPDETMLRDCLELMLANDVEISRREERFRSYTLPYNSELFIRCKDYVSDGGFQSMCDVYALDLKAAG